MLYSFLNLRFDTTRAINTLVDRAFPVSAAPAWNALPASAKNLFDVPGVPTTDSLNMMVIKSSFDDDRVQLRYFL